MTDEELLNRITKMVQPSLNDEWANPIWLLIRDNRQRGWKRRFTPGKAHDRHY